MDLLKSSPYFIFTVALSLFGQVLLRKGVLEVLGARRPSALQFVREHLFSIVCSPYALGGLCLSGLGLVGYLYLLTSYELGRALPIMGGVAYIGMFFAGRLLLNEQTNWFNFAGILLIVLGLYFVSFKTA